MTDLKNAQFIEGTDSQSFIDYMNDKLSALAEDAQKTSSELYMNLTELEIQRERARLRKNEALVRADLTTSRAEQAEIDRLNIEINNASFNYYEAWRREMGLSSL